MRTILVLLAALTLAACNNVHSVRPLVTAAEGAPALKHGLWAGIDKDCAFDPARALADWPDCASGLMVDADHIRSVGAGQKDVMAYRLSGRFPTVVQALIESDPGGKAPDDAPLGPYQYLGLKVLSSDRGGVATEAAFWTALCGPPPPDVKPGVKNRFITEKPLPGLMIVGDACTADTLEAVRGSVQASQAWSPPGVLRWVRAKP